MTAHFVWDYGTEAERVTNKSETEQLLHEIYSLFAHVGRHLIYSHKWRPGDFIISDNAALGHEATPATQAPREVVGLRVMHRTTIQGRCPPRKEYRVDECGYRV